jgi:hypothetical protein
MTICSSGGRVRSACGATFAALLLVAALPLAAPSAAQAQRQGPSHTQREMPMAQPPGQRAPSPQTAQARGAAHAGP